MNRGTETSSTSSFKTAQEWAKVASLAFRIVLGLVLIIMIPLVYIEMKNNPARVNGTDFEYLVSILREGVVNQEALHSSNHSGPAP